MPQDFHTIIQSDGCSIAYRKSRAMASATAEVVVVFLGGFYSNMQGSKAQFLHAFCEAEGIAFVRFDYRGHGESHGEFTNFGISDWLADARLIARLAGGRRLILVGSSMGGWIALRLAQEMAGQVAALIGIAAAPDFTEEGFWQGFDAKARARIDAGGVVYVPSSYDAPYPISAALIRQGRNERIFHEPYRADFPVHLFYGLDDAAVSRETTERLFSHIEGEAVSLELRRGADHRFSRPSDLARLAEVIRAFVNAA